MLKDCTRCQRTTPDGFDIKYVRAVMLLSLKLMLSPVSLLLSVPKITDTSKREGQCVMGVGGPGRVHRGIFKIYYEKC